MLLMVVWMVFSRLISFISVVVPFEVVLKSVVELEVVLVLFSSDVVELEGDVDLASVDDP